MKATGIVRRIDDLGRIVIPKEIRRTLRIREGDPLEIYTEKDGEVIFTIAVVAVAVGGYFFVYQNKNVIDLNRFYTLTLSGYDGNGS